jgi:hypothetical protein
MGVCTHRCTSGHRIKPTHPNRSYVLAWLHVSEVLESFGRMVFERLRAKGTGGKPGLLPDDFRWVGGRCSVD